jgi:hypothetical protein
VIGEVLLGLGIILGFVMLFGLVGVAMYMMVKERAWGILTVAVLIIAAIVLLVVGQALSESGI